MQNIIEYLIIMRNIRMWLNENKITNDEYLQIEKIIAKENNLSSLSLFRESRIGEIWKYQR